MLTSADPKYLRLADTCVHFSGNLLGCCRAGVYYDTVKDQDLEGKLPRFPCFKSDGAFTECARAQFITEEQAKTQVALEEAKVLRTAEKLTRLSRGPFHELRRAEDGTTSFLCGRRAGMECAYCEEPAAELCDHRGPDGEWCDRPMCRVCVSMKDDRAICREHREQAGLARYRKPVVKLAEGDRRRWIRTSYRGRCFNCRAAVAAGKDALYFPSRPQHARLACEACGREAEGQQSLV